MESQLSTIRQCIHDEDRFEEDIIDRINKLYDKGNTIIYWTARGTITGLDWRELTEYQFEDWGVKYHELSVGEKPHYDLLICDKTKRIEEI